MSETLDASIVALVRALNSIAGIVTIGSCGGHDEPARGQWQTGSWYVLLRVEQSEAGWLALELLAWAVNRDWRGANEQGSVILYPDAPPPFLNEPGEVLRFSLEGHGGADADALAAYLDRLVSEYFTEDVADGAA